MNIADLETIYGQEMYRAAPEENRKVMGIGRDEGAKRKLGIADDTVLQQRERAKRQKFREVLDALADGRERTLDDLVNRTGYPKQFLGRCLKEMAREKKVTIHHFPIEGGHIAIYQIA